MRKFYLKNSRMPSYSEVASLFGYRSKNVIGQLIKEDAKYDEMSPLEKEGYKKGYRGKG